MRCSRSISSRYLRSTGCSAAAACTIGCASISTGSRPFDHSVHFRPPAAKLALTLRRGSRPCQARLSNPAIFAAASAMTLGQRSGRARCDRVVDARNQLRGQRTCLGRLDALGELHPVLYTEYECVDVESERIAMRQRGGRDPQLLGQPAEPSGPGKIAHLRVVGGQGPVERIGQRPRLHRGMPITPTPLARAVAITARGFAGPSKNFSPPGGPADWQCTARRPGPAGRPAT